MVVKAGVDLVVRLGRGWQGDDIGRVVAEQGVQEEFLTLLLEEVMEEERPAVEVEEEEEQGNSHSYPNPKLDYGVYL